MTPPTSEVITAFERFIAISIDERGVYPYPCHWIARDGKVCLGALDLSPEQSMIQFWSLAIAGAREIIMGLDRETRPGQGTEFADVLTCVYYRQQPGAPRPSGLRIGVINYQHEPRVVRPIDWGNAFWTEQFTAELRTVLRTLAPSGRDFPQVR